MKRFKKGFTLAEVLITLSIIGIIAAIVMPSVIASYQYKTIGVKLSKFMASTEQASRAYVVSNTTFRNNTLAGRRQILNFMNDSFLFTGLTNVTEANQRAYLGLAEGAALTDAQENSTYAIAIDAAPAAMTQAQALTYTGQNALNVPLDEMTANNAYATLKDGTLLAMQFVSQQTVAQNGQAATTAYPIHTAAIDSAKVGLPVFDLIFSPNVSGLPASAQKTFHFTVTEMGYLVPNDSDACLWTMYDNGWQSTAQTFAEGSVCNNGGQGGQQAQQGNG